MVRKPAVAGQFYTGDGTKLRMQLELLVGKAAERRKAIGIIAPHAGYMYSGAVAGAIYGKIEVPETVVVLGPNHHGRGARAALYPPGKWLTPLGEIRINERLSELLLGNSALLEEDAVAHQYEHSLEVQVPFIQYVQPNATIVPICLGLGDYASCMSLGKSLAKSINEYGREVLIVASSDMSHYEHVEVARKKDELALKEVLALDPEGLYTVVGRMGISMCGIIPAAVMLVAAKERGATRSELIRYATSGDVSGDFEQVVGYAAVAVF